MNRRAVLRRAAKLAYATPLIAASMNYRDARAIDDDGPLSAVDPCTGYRCFDACCDHECIDDWCDPPV